MLYSKLLFSFSIAAILSPEANDLRVSLGLPLGILKEPPRIVS